MRRSHGGQVKWAIYTLAYLALYFIKISVLNRIPIRGVIPELAPMAAAAVGCFEGTFGGAVYGLTIGLFSSAVYYRGGSMMIPICTFIGLLSGFTTDRQVGKNLLGVCVCGIAGIVLLEAGRVLYYHIFGGNPLAPLLTLAVPEGLYSLVFLVPVYILYTAVYRRFRTDTEL